MSPNFQEGRRPRANAVASLTNTGYTHPLSRRPVAGAVQQAHRPGVASRPGPRPLSARQTATINAQNARIRREVAQTIAECQRAVAASNRQAVRQAQSLAFSQYDFDKRPGEHTEMQLPGTYQTIDARRYRAGSLWIYAAELHNGWGDHQYFVYNPQTGAMLHFKPEASITDPKKQLYASKQARIQGTAEVTGRVGTHLQYVYGGLALGGFGAAVAAEAGGYYFITDQVAPTVARVYTQQVAPTVARVSVQAYRVVAPVVRNYVQKAAKGAIGRMATDAVFQYGTGYIAADPARGSKAEQAFNQVNGTSIIAAGLISTDGWSKGAKFLTALGSSAATNLVTVSRGNSQKDNSFWHVANLSDQQERSDYATNVMLGVVFDQVKEHGSEYIGEQAARLLKEHTLPGAGTIGSTLGRWLTKERVTLTTGFIIGGTPETIKKQGENKKAAAEEDAKRRKINASIPYPHP